MASQPGRGVPSIVNSLIRPTTPTQPEPDDQVEGAGESTTAVAPEPRPRAGKPRRKATTNEPAKGRKISIPDSVFERLELTAIRRKTTISAVATDLLDRNLPRLRIESD